MRIILDAHVHSRFARATSKTLSIPSMAEGAKLKGIDIIGTGDFTHPQWLMEAKRFLERGEEGLYTYGSVRFMLTTEICTNIRVGEKSARVHHVIHAPSFEIVDQINEKLKKYGNLKSDGRPMIFTDPANMVDLLSSISSGIFIYPAHAFTPYFGCLGIFDSVEDCYKDQSKKVLALETGMSADPGMIRRISRLDRLACISNSDAHSATPWRLGREANVFDLERPTYREIHDSIIQKDRRRFLFTVETEPSYGRYHLSAHASEGVFVSPSEAKKIGGICPICKKKLTVGVSTRIEYLADRPEGVFPSDEIPYKTLLPLYEIISFAAGSGKLYNKGTEEETYQLIKAFGNEFSILLDVPLEELKKHTKEKIANAIIAAREGKVKYIPGGDGQYGKPVFGNPDERS